MAPLTDRQSCSDPAVYTIRATATPTGRPVQVGIPTAEGFYLVCAAAADDLADASAAVVQVDDTPPVRTPTLSVRKVDSGVLVEPEFSPPELSDFQLKIGPAASTDCTDSAGYQRYRRVPLPIRTDELPALVCVIGSDLAGNAAPPWSQVVTS